MVYTATSHPRLDRPLPSNSSSLVVDRAKPDPKPLDWVGDLESLSSHFVSDVEDKSKAKFKSRRFLSEQSFERAIYGEDLDKKPESPFAFTQNSSSQSFQKFKMAFKSYVQGKKEFDTPTTHRVLHVFTSSL